MINTLTAVLTEKGTDLTVCPLSPAALAGIIAIVEDGTVSTNQAREVLDVIWSSPDKDATVAAAELGYKKADTGALEGLVRSVLEENQDMVELVRAGNAKLVNALTGKVMKIANPKPNPKLVTEIILALIK